MLGLCCCPGFSLVAAREGYSLVVVCRLFVAVASIVAGHRLGWECSSCDSQALEHRLCNCGIDLVVPQHVGSSQTRDQTCDSCTGRQILYQWASDQGSPLIILYLCIEMPQISVIWACILQICWIYLLALTLFWWRSQGFLNPEAQFVCMYVRWGYFCYSQSPF